MTHPQPPAADEPASGLTDEQMLDAVMAYVQAGKRGLDLKDAIRCAVESALRAQAAEQPPTNTSDAAKGNVNAIRHIAYAEGYKDGKGAQAADRPPLPMSEPVAEVSELGEVEWHGKWDERPEPGTFLYTHPYVWSELDAAKARAAELAKGLRVEAADRPSRVEPVALPPDRLYERHGGPTEAGIRRLRAMKTAPSPTDKELIAFAASDEFLLFCDEDEFVQIARGVLQRYAAPPQGPSRMELIDALRELSQALDHVRLRFDDEEMPAGVPTLFRCVENVLAAASPQPPGEGT